jgi:hypothetical protein
MRSRNIKPGFFKNDVLAEIDPLGRILFTGLWCMADREGRLENRSKKIKAEVLPYDNCNITKLLRDLSDKNFITQYSENGNNYIQINNFQKHQSPHIKEAESTIPAPDLHQISTVKESLIPDSLIPDSSVPDSGSPLVHKQDLKTDAPQIIFDCSFFSISQEYFDVIQKEWIALSVLEIMEQFKKMRDWLEGSGKERKRLNSRGILKNPKLFIRNWLNKTEPNSDNAKGIIKYNPKYQKEDPYVLPLGHKYKCEKCKDTGFIFSESQGSQECPCGKLKNWGRPGTPTMF